MPLQRQPLPYSFVPSSTPQPSRRRFLGATLACGASLLAPPLAAQVKVDISGIAANRFNLALGNFVGDLGGIRLTDIIGQDLARTGRFNFNNVTLLADANLNVSDFNVAGTADAAVVGNVQGQGGNYKVGFRLFDVARKVALGGQVFEVKENELRATAHRIADFIFSKLTGIAGAANTHIAYVTGGGSRYSLIVCDTDGANPQEALRSNAPLISVCWSPRGDRLAYTSFELGYPTVFLHNLQTSERKRLINRQCSSPSFAPNGNALLVSLVNRGATGIYRVSVDGGEPVPQVTSSGGIDTRGMYSPDGRYVYFVSNRGGSPQIYRQPAEGGTAERVTFSSAQALAPALSSDGKFLAYIAMAGNGYRLTLQDLSSNTTTALGAGGNDQSPSFAPNGQVLLYTSRAVEGQMLQTVPLVGGVPMVVAAGREASWGPFI